MAEKDEIAPALTPEQWKAQEFHMIVRPNPLTPAQAAGSARTGNYCGEPAVHSEGYFAQGSRHALAALALYGQPFGFTRADVLALIDAAESIQDEFGSRDKRDSRAVKLDAITARIAALLPPEGA